MELEVRINRDKGIKCAVQSLSCEVANAQQLALVLERKMLWFSITDKNALPVGSVERTKGSGGNAGTKKPRF